MAGRVCTYTNIFQLFRDLKVPKNQQVHTGGLLSTRACMYISMHKICTLVTSSLVDVNEVIRVMN